MRREQIETSTHTISCPGLAWLFLGTELESGYHSLLKTASHVLWLPPQCREERSSTGRAHTLLQKEGLRKEPFPPVATCTMSILELPNQLPKDKQGGCQPFRRYRRFIELEAQKMATVGGGGRRKEARQIQRDFPEGNFVRALRCFQPCFRGLPSPGGSSFSVEKFCLSAGTIPELF